MIWGLFSHCGNRSINCSASILIQWTESPSGGKSQLVNAIRFYSVCSIPPLFTTYITLMDDKVVESSRLEPTLGYNLHNKCVSFNQQNAGARNWILKEYIYIYISIKINQLRTIWSSHNGDLHRGYYESWLNSIQCLYFSFLNQCMQFNHSNMLLKHPLNSAAASSQMWTYDLQYYRNYVPPVWPIPSWLMDNHSLILNVRALLTFTILPVIPHYVQ